MSTQYHFIKQMLHLLKMETNILRPNPIYTDPRKIIEKVICHFAFDLFIHVQDEIALREVHSYTL